MHSGETGIASVGEEASAGLVFGALPRRLRALSYFGMVSPGARLRHVIDGTPVAFTRATGSFLAQSWGYMQMWHVLEPPPSAAAMGGMGGVGGRWRPRGAGGVPHELEWKLCTEHVAGDRCVGFRCGLEFKMPMKTAAVGWFVALSA